MIEVMVLVIRLKLSLADCPFALIAKTRFKGSIAVEVKQQLFHTTPLISCNVSRGKLIEKHNIEIQQLLILESVVTPKPKTLL